MSPNITTAEKQINERESNLARKALTLITVKFISMWLFFMVIIFGIAMLTDIDWSRPYLERSMAEATHRQIKLGHLTWTFGLGGLAIDTTHISIRDKSGQPFLNAQASEIGIAFWRLLSGELRIRHLYFERPELWCVRNAPGIWNFDDLLKTAINVDYLECDQGNIHMVDTAKVNSAATFTPINLTSFKLKFVKPTARSNHPVFFSCKAPRNGFETGIKLSGFVRGGAEHWQQNRAQLKLQLVQFAPADLEPIAAILDIDLSRLIGQVNAHKVAGLFDCDIACKGVLTNEFEGSAFAKGSNISITDVDLGLIKAPHLVCKTEFKSVKNILTWKNAEIKLPDYSLEIRSDGALANWRSTDDAKFNGTAIALCDNLASLSKLAEQASAAKADRFSLLSHLQGKALVDLTFSGDHTQTVYKSKLSLSNLAVNNLKAVLPEKYLPLTLLLGLSGSSSQARICGNVSIDSQNSLAFQDCTIVDGATTYKVSGNFDPKFDKALCTFAIKDLVLNKISDSVNQTPQIRGMLSKVLALSKQSQFSFAGKADCQGQFSLTQSKLFYKTDVSLNGADLTISSPKLSLNNVQGHFLCENNKLSLKDFVSTVDSGKLEISGTIPEVSANHSAIEKLQVHLHGRHFELSHLSALLTLFKIDSPFFAHEQLKGLVKDIVLDLDGPSANPNLRFVALPEELYYQPPGLSHPLKAVSGTITFNNERLDLKDVGFALNGGTVVTNLSVFNLLSDARIDKFKLKSAGVDLKDVCYYFNSPLLPPVLREPLLNLSRSCQLTFNGGKAYGFINGTITNGKAELDGLLGLMNANLKLAGCKENLEHVNGVFIASGDKLLVQDTSAYIHGSKFRVDGKISKYQDANPQWNGELAANIDPPELASFVPEMCPQLRSAQIKLNAASRITLKAKAHGSNDSSSISFALNSDPQGRFSIISPVVTFRQPPAENLTMEGSVKLEPDLVDFSDLRLTIGNAIVLAKGSLQQPKTGEAEINLLVRVPDYVPAATLLQILSPAYQNTSGSGRLKGFVTAAGQLSHPAISSELHFDKMSLPDLHISNLTGELITDRPQTDGESSRIKARLNLDSVTIGTAPFSNVTANLAGTLSHANQTSPVIAVTDCRANFAGGKFNLDGSIDLSAKKVCLRASLKQAEADQALSEFFGFKDEITGTLGLDAVLGANFNSNRNSGEILTNVDGSGEIKIVNGNITSFSHLETRITQGKLLHQGIFGFNVNNLFQSVIPVKSGNFRELATSMHFDGGIISIESLEYDGDDLHLTASGKANLALHTVELEIVGKVPRVSNSFIGGPMREISKEFTVQKVIDSLTMHKLESLPSLPILGNVASAGPRQFTFKILAPYDQPKLVSHSIEKSFRWTEDRPLATVVP